VAEQNLTEQVVSLIPEGRRKIMDEVLNKLEGSENCLLLMALVAGASTRERQMVRLLIRELDQFEINQSK
jgi:hypothetical protein